MVNSTAIMAVGARSLSPDGFDPTHRWGYVTLDWSTGWTKWMGNRTDPTKATCEATSSANCVRTYTRNLPLRVVGVYFEHI